MRDITVMIKPASYSCNLRCRYCFYCDEISYRNDKQSPVMTNQTVDSVIQRVFEYSDGGTVNFMFQGGEPLLAGKDYFDYFCRKALKEAKGKVLFEVQTNGTLIDEDYCSIFKEFDFLVGVSLDGPENVHNSMRNNSFSEVMKGIALLRENDISFNILSVITCNTDPFELYEFYQKNDFRYVQTIYCLDSFDGSKKDFSLDAKSYARFRKRLFNRWLKDLDTDRFVDIRDIGNLVNMIVEDDNEAYEQCGIIGECHPNLIIESDGSCYPCDFYCTDEFFCININDSSVYDMLECKGMKKFMEFETPENPLCKECNDYYLCKSGCKRFRYLYNELSGYCPQKDFIDHVLYKLENIK